MRHVRLLPVVLVAALVTALVTALAVAAPASAAAAGDRLSTGQSLRVGQSLTSADGDDKLVLQTDGNLVLYATGRVLWGTGPLGDARRLTLGTDGDLAVTDASGAVLWHTGTTDGRTLVVENGGNLVLYDATGTRARWSTGTPGPRLAAGESLRGGEFVQTADHRYRLTLTPTGSLQLTGPGRTLWHLDTGVTSPRLVMQTDGNLVLYGAAGAAWASNTAGRAGAVATLGAGRLDVTRAGVGLWHSPSPPPRLPAGTWLLPGEKIVSPTGSHYLVLQGDGNLVLYGPGGAGWSTGTRGTPRGLILQGDGNLVLYSTSGYVWASGTNGTAPGALTVQDDGHLVLYTSVGKAAWSVWARSPRLAAAVASAAAFGAANGERTAVAVYDRATGQYYTAGDVNAGYASASLVKVFIAARLLSQRAQADPNTNALMYRMITLSDDSAATTLWPRAGGAGVTDWVQARYGITGLGHPTTAGWWGLTQVTATAMVRFYAAVKNDPAVGPWLTDAMAHAANYAADGWNQWFGIPSATSGWKVKQGWMCCLDTRSRLHSTGFLAGDRYTAAILTDGPTSFYGPKGAAVVTGAATRLLPGRVVPS